MTMTRRRFVGSAAALGAAAAADLVASHAGAVRTAAAAAGPITPELIALNRIAFGPRGPQSPLAPYPPGFPGDVAAIQFFGGLDGYIEQQLNPAAIDDSHCDAQLAAVRFRINYGAGTGYAARNELLPLGYLGRRTTDPLPHPAASMPPGARLWDLRNWSLPMAYSERMRPWHEVRVATFVRAIYSERQLLEVLVDFWHNHFNVWPDSDVNIAVAFPEYDAIIRQHALGNFRAFLEAIATSTAMLYYLDNYANRAAGGEGGNENYARELFELHTLGSDNYLKFYDDIDQVGTITYGGEEFARGYIDSDVYEASECLTGWTVRNGDWRLPGTEPNDGTFLYHHPWHSGGIKFLLGRRIDNGQSQADYMKDGRDVLQLLSDHVGTARFLCQKLCRRLIADNPPANVVEAAVAEWMASRSAPDQIARVVRVILSSAEFRSVWGQKVKRPFEFIVSYIRATGARLRLVDDAHPERSCWGNFASRLGETGHRLFEWQPPTGYPDLASFWLSTNGMLRRWNLPYYLTRTGEWEINAELDLLGQTNMGLSCTEIVDAWIGRLFGYDISATTRDALIAFLAQEGSPDSPPAPYQGESSLQGRLESMVHLMAMSPEFQLR